MSVAATKWARTFKLDRSSKAVLLDLAERANAAGVCWPSYEIIAVDLCLCISAVQKAIKRLRKAGVIELEMRYDGRGKRTSNRYRLQLEIEAATTSTAELKKRGDYQYGGAEEEGRLPVRRTSTTSTPRGDHYIEPPQVRNHHKKEEPPQESGRLGFSSNKTPPTLTANSKKESPQPSKPLTQRLDEADDLDASDEERFWAAVDVLDVRKGGALPRSQMTKLGQLVGDFDELLGILRRVAAVRDPPSYLAKIIHNRRQDQIAASGLALVDEPEFVTDFRREGVRVRKVGKGLWECGRTVYDLEGIEVAG